MVLYKQNRNTSSYQNAYLELLIKVYSNTVVILVEDDV